MSTGPDETDGLVPLPRSGGSKSSPSYCGGSPFSHETSSSRSMNTG